MADAPPEARGPYRTVMGLLLAVYAATFGRLASAGQKIRCLAVGSYRDGSSFRSGLCARRPQLGSLLTIGVGDRWSDPVKVLAQAVKPHPQVGKVI